MEIQADRRPVFFRNYRGVCMSSIRVQQLGKSFGIHTIFSDVSFSLHRGERLGLVGANGEGKSTLLMCLLGLEEVDTGNIAVEEGDTIGYLQQQITYDPSLRVRDVIKEAWQDIMQLEDKLHATEQALQDQPQDEQLMARYARLQERFEWLGGFSYESMSRKIMAGLGFQEEDWDRHIQDFSGGQKTRINLAKALVRCPDYLFLDEPTNHLDVDMLEWLETYLLSYGGGMIIVSHDRYFLDRVATGILSLSKGTVKKYKGNYTAYVKKRQAEQDAHAKAYAKQQEKIHATEAYIQKYKAGIKAKQARGRQSQLDRLVRLEADVPDETLQFSFTRPSECGQKVLVLDDVGGQVGDHSLFNHLSALLRRGERVALIGPNGIGKSSLLKMVMGELKPTAGHIVLGSRVSIGYFSQERTDLHGAWSIVEEIMQSFSYSEDQARLILGRFLFHGDEVYKTIDSLSGGEQARVALLKLFLTAPNVLLLDEPTNHLDIPTREILEEALLEFGGTYIIVSHDRYFLDKVTNKTWVLAPQGVTEYMGNYSYYREKWKDQQEALMLAVKPTRDMGKVTHTDTGKKEPSSQPVKKKIHGNAKKIEEVELKIAELEATVTMYEVQLNMPENQVDNKRFMEIHQAYEETKKKLDALYETWEMLAE